MHSFNVGPFTSDTKRMLAMNTAFALVLTVFMAVILFKPNIPVIILVTMMLVLLAFYIKHYYFLENTVQKMYKVYDGILEKQKKLKESSE